MADTLERRTLDAGSSTETRYLLYLPPELREPRARGEPSPGHWPLVLFLHGAGERDDNLDKLTIYGPPMQAAEGREFPFILATPQLPPRAYWSPALLLRLLDALMDELPVDADRVAVTGVSMGGSGTWALGIAAPDRFAALAPICGGGRPDEVCALKDVPVWAFHGAQDDIVPIIASEEMVNALRACGGSVWFTVYPEAGHDSWVLAYTEPNFYPWLLAQRRGQPPIAPGDVPPQ